MPTPDDSARNAAPARPFQFTLRTMFIVTTIVAILCAGLSARAPRWYSLFIFFSWATTLPLVFIILTIYVRGRLRAFGIGGLLAFLPLLIVDITLAVETLTYLIRRSSFFPPFDRLAGDYPVGPILSLVVGCNSSGGRASRPDCRRRPPDGRAAQDRPAARLARCRANDGTRGGRRGCTKGGGP